MTNPDLDMDWVKEYARMHSIQQIVTKEEIDYITIQSIYMNTKREINKINKEAIKLSIINHTHRGISKEQMLQIIQRKQNDEQTKYTLVDIILYSIDLEPKDIQRYVNDECRETSKLIPLSIVNDVIIKPSLFIFHSLHTLVLLFDEVDISNPNPIKSIIKTPGNVNSSKHLKHTKKVRINASDIEIIPTKGTTKKTRKIWV